MITIKRTLGVGLTSKAQIDDMKWLLQHFELNDITAVATLSGKENDIIITLIADALSVPILTFSSDQLEKITPRLKNPSQHVYQAIGCHGVAEAAALSACGANAILALEKYKYGGLTIAIAEEQSS